MVFAELFSSPLAQRWAIALVHFLWQGLLIAVLVEVLLKLLRARRAEIRYAACLAALTVAAACPVVTFALIDAGPESEGLAAQPPAQLAELPDAQQSGPAELSPNDPTVAIAPPRWERPNVFADHKASASLGAAWLARARRVQPWIVLLWVTGVLVLSGRLLLGAAGVRRLKRKVEPISAEIADCARRLSRRLRMNRLPPVYASAKVLEATAVGFFRPAVLLPTAWLTGFSPAMLEAVLAHELAHIRRGDLWVNLFQRVVETLLFYHPAVWWLSRRLRIERELSCDELAVCVTGDRLTYVTALEQLARRRRAATQPFLGAAIGGTNMPLLDRVRNVLGLQSQQRPSSSWLAGLISLAAAGALWFSSIDTTGTLHAQQSRSVPSAPRAVTSAPKSVEPSSSESATTPVAKVHAAPPEVTSRVVGELKAAAQAVAWSPDGKTLVSGDWTVYLWNTENWEVRSSIKLEESYPVRSLCFSGDATQLATGTGKSHSIPMEVDGKKVFRASVIGEVRIYDTKTGQRKLSVENGQNYWVHAVAFSPDGRTLAAGAAYTEMQPDNSARTIGGQLLLVDTLTGGHTDAKSGSKSGWIHSLAYSPDGAMLATVESDVALWDTRTNEIQRRLSHPASSVAFSPDGKLVATGGRDKTAKLWDPSSGELKRSLPHPDEGGDFVPIQSVAFSPDGHLLATATAAFVKGTPESTGGAIRLWDVATGEMLHTLDDHAAGVNAVAFSPDGKHLASASDDKTVRVWDVSALED